MNPEKFNGNTFKAYHGWIVGFWSGMVYIYSIGTAQNIIITGNPDMNV